MLRVKILSLAFLSLLVSLTSCSSTSLEEEVELYENVTVSASVSNIEEEVFTLVNEYRVSQGLTEVEFSAVAYNYAFDHNEYMISEDAISHDNFNKRSSDLAVEVSADFVSENVGRNYVTASGIVNAWINSDTHRAVMEGDFDFAGISVEEDADGVLYFTQLFFK
ncbi:CAP domain-containing protein [Cellulophaga baltica]|uniref:CAP domain-containing protein n=1 Tax=Cellulophaga TaxID=104264 RepID=UPI001C06577A|nr:MULTISPECIES: CAP domain-containing protein [Cellulophaga]MBU2996767.1 CAP domain-containing protein [Cellulophaga baltica]MDO6768163.1 CAP domain-containing protein [Cellulophaga sp. 1_MG-2023]